MIFEREKRDHIVLNEVSDYRMLLGHAYGEAIQRGRRVTVWVTEERQKNMPPKARYVCDIYP